MNYLGRPIGFARVMDPPDLPPLRESTLLLWLASGATKEARARLATSIASADPLAVMIGGTGSEELFDELLGVLDREVPPRAMLTKMSGADLEETLADFLQATWPYEDRMDSWKAYCVACFGDDVGGLRSVAAAIASGTGVRRTE